jgi:hypothetical protein
LATTSAALIHYFKNGTGSRPVMQVVEFQNLKSRYGTSQSRFIKMEGGSAGEEFID